MLKLLANGIISTETRTWNVTNGISRKGIKITVNQTKVGKNDQ